MYVELITAALAIAPTTLVPRQVESACPTPITCPTNDGCTSLTANGALFQLKCATNFNGPIIGINQAASFAQCVTACSVLSGCKGLNYKGRFCYLLGNDLGATQSVANVRGAIQTKSATTPSPTAGSSTCTTNIRCPANDGCLYKANSKDFFARCSSDFYGGDIENGDSTQPSLKACVDKCSTTAGCVAVSYKTSGICYLKSSLQPAVYSANTHGAYIN